MKTKQNFGIASHVGFNFSFASKMPKTLIEANATLNNKILEEKNNFNCFNYLGIRFTVQAYKKDDFVNISPIQDGKIGLDNEMWAVKIEFGNKNKMTHGGKDNTAMRRLLQEIQPLEVKEIVDKIFA